MIISGRGSIPCGLLLVGLCLSQAVTYNMNQLDKHDGLRISAWNSRGLGSARLYLEKLMSVSDVVCLSEHQLYEAELNRLTELSNDFNAYGRSSSSLKPDNYGKVPGHCGVGILWRKTLSACVRPLKDLSTDRFCAIELTLNDRVPLYIVSVYMPQQGCIISDYDEQLDALEACLSQWQGQVVIAGDCNAHLSRDHGHRGWGNTNRNGRSLVSAMQRHALVAIDMSPLCTGPDYTYCNSRGQTSYIDHSIISASLTESVRTCAVLADEVANTSDHLAIHITMDLQCSETTPKRSCATKHVQWHKLTEAEIRTKYTHVLEDLVQQFTCTVTTPDDVTVWTQDDIENMTLSAIEMTALASSQLPKRRPSKAKSYWNPALSTLSRDKKAAWRLWVQAGSPRTPDSVAWRRYQEAKRDFRREQRRAMYQTDLDYIKRVEENAWIDQRSFWGLVNRRYKPPNGNAGVKPFRAPDGTVLTGEEQIREGWRDYFENLYTPKTPPHYDEDFRVETEQRLRDIERNMQDADQACDPLDVEDVAKACRKLKSGKAPGADGVQPEHLRYAGQGFLRLLTRIFDAIIYHEWRPDVLKRGIIVTLPKGSKDCTVPDNNRGITLMPVLGKVLDSLLLKSVDTWMTTTLDRLQGANRSGVSSLETAACLQQAIATNTSPEHATYVALLDVKKAFDTVWQTGLFVQLHDMGLDRKIWRILRNSYTNFHCAVRVGTGLSSWFEPSQGVHQGDVFSMRLYSLYVNSLLAELGRQARGLRVGTVDCGQPSFADDIALAAPSKTTLNQQLATCHRYSCKWRYEFSIQKTFVLVFGRDQQRQIQVQMNGQPLQVVDSHLHVGVPLYTTRAAETVIVADRMKSCRRKYYMIEGATGPGTSMTPLTLSCIYQAVCIPALIYGAEVWSPSETSLRGMERMHAQLGRRIQGLPPSASGPVSYSTLGWLSIGGLFDLAKLLWIVRLLSLPYTSPYHQVAVWVFTLCRFSVVKPTGPFAAVYSVCERYGLITALHSMMDTGDLPSRAAWKRRCSTAVRERQDRRWQMTRVLYGRLNLFNLVVRVARPLVWWTVCRTNPTCTRHCKTVVKLLTGESCLNSHRGRFVNGARSRLCTICEEYEEETVPHLISQCSTLAPIRQTLWLHVTAVAPRGWLQSFELMNIPERSRFLCSGFGPYVREWQSLYEAVARFLSMQYKSRCNLI